MSVPSTLKPLLRSAARRLAQRRAVRGAAVGAAVGLGLGLATIPLRLVGVPALALSGGVVALLALGAGLGAAVGALRRGLTERELALLVDRSLDSDEAVITAVHQQAHGRVDAGLARVVEGLGSRGSEVVARLPVRPPPWARWLPMVALVLLAAPWLTPPSLASRWGPTDPDAVVAEGERLAERLAALEDAAQSPEAQLPKQIQREVADLAADLQGEELTPQEAVERLDTLQQQLDSFREELAPSERLLDDLEDAARQLDSEATDALAEALSNGDLGAAADAASDLSDALSQASPEEQQQAAEALQQAGEQLQQSSDPGLQQAGEAMQQAGEQLEQQANPRGQQGQGQQGEGQQGEGHQGEGQQGQPGAQGQGQQGEALGQQLEEALRQQRELGDRLARDQQRLQQAQDLQGAVEGAQQRMGEPGAGQGEGQGQGEGEGEGDNQQVAVGNGQGVSGKGAGAGEGHTWEDEGEFDAAQQFSDGESSEGRTTDAPEGGAIDDFEQFYAPLRVEDAQALLASEEGQLDEQGRVDTLVTRLTESDETAQLPTVELPSNYREAAAEAIEAERIPPAYREAVKQYFDDMK